MDGREPQLEHHVMSTAVLGIDIGSVSVKYALLSETGRLVASTYTRHHGEPLKAALSLLEDLDMRGVPSRIGITGTGSQVLSHLIGGTLFNEVLAQARGGSWASSGIQCIIDIGGNDSKLILLGDHGKVPDPPSVCAPAKRAWGGVEDFAMNDLCAAGTGSFLDQQASRLKIRIEGEWGDLAMQSQAPPRIAGRCTVFAKSDMIHLQQRGTPVHDIVSGLCFAVARNFKSVIAKGKDIRVPVSFQGGVAANRGMIRAFRDVFELNEGDLIVSKYHAVTGALGAALLAMDGAVTDGKYRGLADLRKYLQSPPARGVGHKPLHVRTNAPEPTRERPRILIEAEAAGGRRKIPTYLGIDIGSTSTKVVAMAESGEVLSFRYMWTSGRPIEAVKTELKEIGEEIGRFIDVKGVGTTGSGRYLIGDFVGADIVKNEITAQSRAALAFDPTVDTLFEIGGQDSKYVSLAEGVVVDFEMNKVCAAGTGSFLQEQAERLGMDIEKNFGPAAIKASCPTKMGERCTVFIESDLIYNQQAGAPKEDLAAGLAYSIINNYLNKVVGKKPIGDRIVFQGAVAFNQAVVSSFEAILGKRIVVSSHPHITGSIGAAILAREHIMATGKSSSFQGFDLGEKSYEASTFECRACSNICEVSRVSIEKRPPLFYGARCDIFEVDRKSKKLELADLFKEREELLMKEYLPVLQTSGNRPARGTVGIPRTLSLFYEFFPFWKAFFLSLGFDVVLSDVSHKDLIHEGCETVTSETCFPVKIAHGHISNLLEKNVDHIFIPSIVGLAAKNKNFSQHYSCPYIQSISYLGLAAIESGELRKRLLNPAIYFNRGKGSVRKTLAEMASKMGVSRREVSRALNKALQAQEEFTRLRKERGKAVLASLSPSGKAAALIGRPYNTCDPGANMDLPKKMRDLGVQVIPMDFLPYEEVDVSGEHPNMFWAYGQKILEAAEFVRRIPGLYPVYLTNFACGPDSFVLHYFKDSLKGKPSLILEVDEHSADAGLVTRCEAFLDSIHGRQVPERIQTPVKTQVLEKGRTLYLPYMMDAALALTSCLRYHGIRAEVLPPSDDQSLELGRKFCSGKECLPCIVTTGDILKLIKDRGINPDTSAVFMPTSDGPCRFGQYSRLQRTVLDSLGYEKIPIISPTSENGYGEIGNLGVSFQRQAWQGIVAVDLLEKCVRQVRPYEVNSGESDDLYGKFLRELCLLLETGEAPLNLLTRARKEFSAVRIRPEPRPVIGIVGEIFLRLHSFSNRDVARKIETLGGEAWVASMGEWILYTTYLYKKNSKRRKRVDMILMSMLKEKTQITTEHRLTEPFVGWLKNIHEPVPEALLSYAAPYLRDSFGGEAILTIGKAIDYVRRGASGIINTLPFTCMPGNTVRGISRKVREDLGGVPWLNMVYDGSEIPNERTRLEAFVHQARSWTSQAIEKEEKFHIYA